MEQKKSRLTLFGKPLIDCIPTLFKIGAAIGLVAGFAIIVKTF
jgi:hypothetical protein